jgi:hypothetical protein
MIMGKKSKNSLLSDTPSALQALLWLIVTTIILFGIGEGIEGIFRRNGEFVGALPYIIGDILIAGGCFFIIRRNPVSIAYVPVICNLVGIVAALIEPTFWKTSLWIVTCGGWLLSLIVSVTAFRIGRRSGNIRH